jgi:flagellar protein FlbD
MIQVTRINRTAMVLNSDLIEHIETTPDTVISLTTGQKFVVRESAEEIVERVVRFRAAIGERLKLCNLNPRPQAAHASDAMEEDGPGTQER